MSDDEHTYISEDGSASDEDETMDPQDGGGGPSATAADAPYQVMVDHGRHVEDDGKIGDHFTYREPIDLGDGIVGNLSCHALIYGSGVKEAVAKNDLALAYPPGEKQPVAYRL